MRLLILGASGRTGKHVVSQALAKGYLVNCLIRKPEEFDIEHTNLTIYKGSPVNIENLEMAWRNSSSIINVLNISRVSDFPWSKLRTPERFLSDVMKNIIDLAKVRSLKRLIVCSAWGVRESFTELPLWFKLIIKTSNIGVAYRDHERQEELIRKTEITWTIVRPVGLTNSNKSKTVIETFENSPKPNITISR